MSKKEVMLVTGAGQISMAIARRMGYSRKIVMGDKKIENARAIAEIMNNAGYAVNCRCQISSQIFMRKLPIRISSSGYY